MQWVIGAARKMISAGEKRSEAGLSVSRVSGAAGLSSRGATVVKASRHMAALLVFLVAFVASCPVSGVPVRPDLLERLREEGRLEEFLERTVELELDACRRGLDAPPSAGPLFQEGLPVQSVLPSRMNAIVLLVDFNDNEADTLSFPPSSYLDLLFSMGANPNGSLREYYLENSFDRLDVGGAVTRWYRLPQLYSYYVAGRRGIGPYPRNCQKMVEDAIAIADWDVNFANFDNDGPDGIPDSGDDDGYVDALFVVHAGPGFEETLDTNDVHSHSWSIFRDVTLDGVKVRSYAMQPENGKVGVFCHEFGHILGLLDLYDRDYSSRGLGYWSLMAYGSWMGWGVRPGHLDAWSKIRAGFCNPVVPSANVENVSFPPVELEPVIYKLWDSGAAGDEYFLVERRKRIGFDELLPGEGMLIYHVDEAAGSNDNAFHYRVALEQADGCWHLENNFNVGDAGDPYPGASWNHVFGYETVPGSMGYGGIDSRVRVFGITEIDTELTADIWVQQGPNLFMSRFVIVDTLGNNDGNPDVGETVSLNLYLTNIGSEAPGVMAALVPRDPCVSMLNSLAGFGTMRPHTERVSSPPFVFTVCDTISRDPCGVWFDLYVVSGDGYERRDSVLVGVGNLLGFADDAEVPGVWEHYSARVGWNDEWHLSTRRRFEGESSWVCARNDSAAYLSRDDAVLVTPVILLGEEPRFLFYYWIDAQADTGGAFDGGTVEISANGSAWQSVAPVGGYPYLLRPGQDSPLGGVGVFSGPGTDWKRVEFNLAAYARSAVRLRFRFFSNPDSIVGEGWYVDSMTVITSQTPVWICCADASEKDGCIELSWKAMRELRGAAFSVWRSPGPEGEPGLHLVSREP
ncbi:MAG: M6 family metalloprotease domain-containing protein, partial [Candidatus Eisenbacteria bacterium]